MKNKLITRNEEDGWVHYTYVDIFRAAGAGPYVDIFQVAEAGAHNLKYVNIHLKSP